MPRPEGIKAYYILHVENLSQVAEEGYLLSDKAARDLRPSHTNIGMSEIKQSRLIKQITCCPGKCVGEFVPFYLCPRSVMLYVIWKANHPGLTYRDGQEPIVHLEFDAGVLARWAVTQDRPWAVSYGNAASAIARFATGKGCMDDLNWDAINAHWFADSDVQEAKQSEFLIHDRVPFGLVERIGTLNVAIRQRVNQAIESSGHRPKIVIQPNWYF